eukprot:g2366.t1
MSTTPSGSGPSFNPDLPSIESVFTALEYENFKKNFRRHAHGNPLVLTEKDFISCVGFGANSFVKSIFRVFAGTGEGAKKAMNEIEFLEVMKVMVAGTDSERLKLIFLSGRKKDSEVLNFQEFSDVIVSMDALRMEGFSSLPPDPNVRREALVQLFKEIDTNSDGSVQWSEFLEAAKSHRFSALYETREATSENNRPRFDLENIIHRSDELSEKLKSLVASVEKDGNENALLLSRQASTILSDMKVELYHLRSSIKGSDDVIEKAQQVAKRRKEREDKQKSDEISNPPKPPERRKRLSISHEKSIADSTIGFGDKRWQVVLDLMRGVEFSALRSQGISQISLRKGDYYSSSLDHIASVQDENAINQFEAFAPRVFNHLRTIWGVTTEKYIKSLGFTSLVKNFVQGGLRAFSGAPTKAGSGAFFYFSYDRNFLIKTISQDEFNLVFKHNDKMNQSWLEFYTKEMTQDPGCVLVRICGLYKLRLHSKNNLDATFIVMQNIFPGHKFLNALGLQEWDDEKCNSEDHQTLLSYTHLHRMFDLKGSTKSRSNKKALKQALVRFGTEDLMLNNAVMKDIDFLRLGFEINLTEEKKNELIESLTSITNKLAEWHIMDYSFFLGVRFRPLKSSAVCMKTEERRKLSKILLHLHRQGVDFKAEERDQVPKIVLSRKEAILIERDVKESKENDSKEFAYQEAINAASEASNHISALSGVYGKYSVHGESWFSSTKDRYFIYRNGYLLYWDRDSEIREDDPMLDVPSCGYNLLCVEDDQNGSPSILNVENEIRIRFKNCFYTGDPHPKDVTDYVLRLHIPNAEQRKIVHTSLHQIVIALRKLYAQLEYQDVKYIEGADRKCNKWRRTEGGIVSKDQSCCYYIGVIDCLVRYDAGRKFHRLWSGANGSQLEPKAYAHRFTNNLKTRYMK